MESATAPNQYALRTRAGCECIAHALQGLCDVDPKCHDHLDRWHWRFRPDLSSSDVEGVVERGRRRSGDSFRPLVLRIAILLFVGRFFWHHPHDSPRGGRRARRSFDAGQHAALQAIDSDLNDHEFLFAFLGRRLHCDNRGQGWRGVQVSAPTSVGFLQNPHQWRKDTGVDRPDFCDTLERIARAEDFDARVWRGSEFASGFSKGSKSSVLPWGILHLWQHTSTRRLTNKHCFWNGSQQSPICNLRGLSCFVVQRPDQITC